MEGWNQHGAFFSTPVTFHIWTEKRNPNIWLWNITFHIYCYITGFCSKTSLLEFNKDGKAWDHTPFYANMSRPDCTLNVYSQVTHFLTGSCVCTCGFMCQTHLSRFSFRCLSAVSFSEIPRMPISSAVCQLLFTAEKTTKVSWPSEGRPPGQQTP